MVKIVKLAFRDFRCLNCGHVQPIRTNHEHTCISYCKYCSWKPSFGNPKMQYPIQGRTYRPFVFAAQIPECKGCWLTGRCENWCEKEES